jgi:DNA-binding PadR family transcriptional regulator
MSGRSLQEPSFLILIALAAQPQHGYGLIAEVQRISDGQVKLLTGTLYAALDRLEGDGLIVADRQEIVDGRARRYYRLTGEGVQRLAAETQRLRRHVDAATKYLAAIRPGLMGGAA